ncbi:MAG: DegT/DnrJ/EryC1/StrS family aminotransferase [Deltaproteobacteria bacterium]|nr:DegT/DnrJ/EryC1/StrS family aminotransferase [Deltaproteobacteria bacterium]
MKVPLLDLKAQLLPLESEIKSALNAVVDSTAYINGPAVAELEKAVAAYTGSACGIGVSSGTDALLVSLMALDIGPGDIVVTTPYSFFATAGTVARLGAEIALVDIDSASYNIDPQALGAWFEREREKAERVKAIIPVHLYGQCADMDAIMQIGRSRGIAVIEDAAQAIGAGYPSASGLKKAGSMGTFGCFSFFPSKNLGGIGDGGMVVTDDAALADKVRLLRNHGAHPKYYHALIGGNFRLDTVQAAVLLVKLPHLESWHAMRRVNAAYYDELFAGTNISVPAISYGREHHIYNQYVISVPEKRDELRAWLTHNDIGNEVYYPVAFHEQECFRSLGCKKGDFPHSEFAAGHTLALPVYPEITRPMQERVVEMIQKFFR